MNIALKIQKEIEKEGQEIDLETIQKIIATYERLHAQSSKNNEIGPLKFRSDIFLKDDSKSFGPQGHNEGQ